MKLNNIFPNYETFKSDVIDKLILLFPNVEWLDEQNSYMSFQTLYGLLILYYGDRDIRYDNSQTFINKFTFDLADILPDIYAKQQVFINNELKTFLSSARNRAIKIQGSTTNNRQQNNSSKAANSTTPTNMVITTTAELNNLPITSANLSDITLIDNINTSNEQTNFKFIDDLIKNLTSDYSLRLKEFMNLIKNHFTFIDTSDIKKECDSLYDGTRFRNGYYVSSVDYLGLENQEQIILTNNKVQTNIIEIEKLQSNLGSLKDYYKKYQIDSIVQQINIKYNALNVKVSQNETDILQLNDNQAELWAYLENQYLVDHDLTNMYELRKTVTNNTTEINNVKSSLEWKEITNVIYGDSKETNYCDVNFNLPDGANEIAFVGRFFITPNDTQQRAYVAINGVYKNDNTNLFVSCFLQYNGLVIAQIQGGWRTKRVRIFNQNGGPFIGTTENENFKIFYR